MERSLKTLAKEAKQRMKRGFWKECEEKLATERSYAKEQGINEGKLERYFQEKVASSIKGEEADEFYEKVKRLLLSEGEVSDAIGRLRISRTMRRSPMPRSSATISNSRRNISPHWSASNANMSSNSRDGCSPHSPRRNSPSQSSFNA